MSASTMMDIRNLESARDQEVTATTAEQILLLTKTGGDIPPARYTCVCNVGTVPAYVSRDGGATWKTVFPGGGAWTCKRPLFRLLYKTLAGTAKLEVETGY